MSNALRRWWTIGIPSLQGRFHRSYTSLDNCRDGCVHIFHGVGNCDEPVLRSLTFTMAVVIAGAIILIIFDDNLYVPTACLGSKFWSSFNTNHVLLGGCQTRNVLKWVAISRRSIISFSPSFRLGGGESSGPRVQLS